MRNRLDLISKAYRREQRLLHESGYGEKGGRHWAETVIRLAREHAVAEVLDYGCGAGSLSECLSESGLKVRNYDPAVRRFEALPKPTQMVVSTDVLEHVEPERLDAVLAHIASVMLTVGLFSISTVEANKTLSDGRNAHISLHPRDWWLEKLAEFFHITATLDDEEMRPEKQVVVVVAPKEH